MKSFKTKDEIVELDLTHVPNRAHIIVRLKDNQEKPSFVFVWKGNCYYCGKEFNRYRYPRKDCHHHCSKKCVDSSRNRSPRNRKLVKVIKEQVEQSEHGRWVCCGNYLEETDGDSCPTCT